MISINLLLHKSITFYQGKILTLYKPVIRNFKRPWVIATYINKQWSADVLDFNKKIYVADNGGYSYILVCCDILSKVPRLSGLKSKGGKDTAAGFKSIFDTSVHPDYLEVEGGGEFHNKFLHDLIKQYDITMFTTYSEKKWHRQKMLT